MAESSAKIVVIEDDPQIRSFIAYAVKTEGMDCVLAATAEEGLLAVAESQTDLILLDLGLPDMDGMEVIRRVRVYSETPIIIVSARDRDEEKVAALDAGADDYLTKPFSTVELMARIRVALRHLFRTNRVSQTVLKVGELSLDNERHRVVMGENEVHLTPLEFKLLEYMMRNAGKVSTTQTLLKEVWGTGYAQDTQALRTLMAALRRKLEQNPAKPRYLLTEIGIGYRLADE